MTITAVTRNMHPHQHRRNLLLSASAICAIARALAGDLPPVAALPSLSNLEARAAKENQYPSVNPLFHLDAVRLVESNTLTTGEEFLRAANIASGPFPDFRAFRMRYELTLAAAAKGNRDAEKLIPENWDALLQTLGRPIRT